MTAPLTPEAHAARSELILRRVTTEGATLTEIASGLGVTNAALSAWISRYHPELRERVHTNANAARTKHGGGIWINTSASPGMVRHHIRAAEHNEYGLPITNNELENMQFMTHKEHDRLHRGLDAKARIETIRKMRSEGATKRGVASELGIGVVALYYWVKRNWNEFDEEAQIAWLR